MHPETLQGAAAPSPAPTPAEPAAPPGVAGQPAATKHIEGAGGTWAYVDSRADGRIDLNVHCLGGYVYMRLLPQDARDLATQLVAHARLVDGVNS